MDDNDYFSNYKFENKLMEIILIKRQTLRIHHLIYLELHVKLHKKARNQIPNLYNIEGCI